MNRLTRLKIENYRSIRGKHVINLDAPVVLIHGSNGSGKTSLLSAIEMGLTGDAVAMQRADEHYIEHLVHRDAQQAKIEIECRHESLQLGAGELLIEQGGVKGEPHLPIDARRFFKERSFLAQATLSRLLDIYQPTSNKGEDALTRFVRELVGLDVYDNLLSGLHHVRHKTRVRASIPSYGTAEDKLKRLKKEQEVTQQEWVTLSKEFSSLKASFSEDLNDLGVEFDRKTDSIEAIFTDTADEETVVKLVSLEREIRSAIEQWRRLSVNVNTVVLAKAKDEVLKATAFHSDWEKNNLEKVAKAIGRGRELSEDLPTIDSAGLKQAVASGHEFILRERTRLDAKIKNDEEARLRLKNSQSDLQKAKGRITRLDQRIEQLSADSGSLAQALSEIEPFINGEMCPVCHRDFDEIDGSTLHNHLTSHISTLASAANELRSTTSDRQKELRRQDKAVSEINDLNIRLPDASVKARDEARKSQIDETSIAFEEIVSIVQEGVTLEKLKSNASTALSTLQRQEHTLDSLQNSSSSFSEKLSLAAQASSEDFETYLVRCLNKCKDERLSVETSLAKKLKIKTLFEKVTSQEERLLQLDSKKSEADKEINSIEKALASADKTCAKAKKLAGMAETVRSDIVRQVFNEKLNDIWSDLFVRLAPDEQFVPAFAFPEGAARQLSVSLETRLRDGAIAGHPKSILSAGNLNTAALTLFLSLHLAVEPILPWLVIDDPVQSMDEIHTAQFAALVRSLSRQGGRQVIIAVHERPLFEYLALELNPAYQDDRLITIELERLEGFDTKITPVTKTWDPKSIFHFPELAAG